MINVEDEYKKLLTEIISDGANKEDRTGIGTRALFGRMLEHNMESGFPLLTTKKMFFNNAITELLWILKGRTDLAYLNEHKVNYWNADYERSKRTDGTLGPVYGHQWRNFNGVDQIKQLIESIKTNPQSRRLLVSAWNPTDLPDMALPPCHYGFQLYINNGKMDLLWTQRSVDVFLGLPYNFAMYGLLLIFIAKGTGYKPNRLIASLGDCHIYNNHIDQVKEQLSRDTRKLPTVEITVGIDINQEGELTLPSHDDIKILGYDPHPIIKAELNVGN